MHNLSFPLVAVAMAIASTRYAYPRRDGQAELAWVAGLNTEMVYPRMVTHINNNRARRKATMLIKTNALQLCQTATQ